MNLVFEKRLALLERDHPCDSDRGLLALVDSLIEEELAKGDAGDTDLISEAVRFALTLKGVDDGGADCAAEKALEYVGRRSERRTSPLASRRAVALIAAVMALLAFSIGVYALVKIRFDMDSITKDEFESIEKNKPHTEENMDYYISDKVAVYGSVDEFLSDGQTDSLLYPEGYECESITVSELDGYKEIRFIFGEVQMVIETPITRELYFPDRPVGEHMVSVIELEDGYQSEFIYDGCIYSFISPTFETAEQMITSLSERCAK